DIHARRSRGRAPAVHELPGAAPRAAPPGERRRAGPLRRARARPLGGGARAARARALSVGRPGARDRPDPHRARDRAPRSGGGAVRIPSVMVALLALSVARPAAASGGFGPPDEPNALPP